jgi:hypothetical protein
MPKYLFEARYTADGAKGLAREGGSGRRAGPSEGLPLACFKTSRRVCPTDENARRF